MAIQLDQLLEGNRGFDCDDPALEERVDELILRMTRAQKINEMHGKPATLYESGGDPEIGIPKFVMYDGPRGVARIYATAFPVAMARGASFDPGLEKRVGEAIALEVKAAGGNFLLAPTLNILRHPGWGRAQETYSEDPHHMGMMALGFIGGAQKHLLACAKHFAGNSIENTRFDVSANMDERTLREVYLPHFRRAVQQAKVASVMSAYNRVNGTYCGEHPHLLDQVLRNEWGFRGFVISDWLLGTRSTVPALKAGLDIEMPGSIFYEEKNIADAIEAGEIDDAMLDRAVTRILRMKFCFELDSPEPVAPSVISSSAHLALAQEVAEKSIVLLKNQQSLLPLSTDIRRIAVYGALAKSENTGDRGSSAVLSRPGNVSTILSGIEEVVPHVEVLGVDTDTPSEQEMAYADNADVALVVVGLTERDEGEYIPTNREGEQGGDRADLSLSKQHAALVRSVAERAAPTVVVLVGGSAIVMRDWVDAVDGVLMAWYAGQKGGVALAKILFGLVNPSGKLPITIARQDEDYPPWDIESHEVQYDYYHGYRLLDHKKVEPEFPFGFGMSYTNYKYDNLRIDEEHLSFDDTLVAELDVCNTGTRSGDEIVQLYISAPGTKVSRAVRDLIGFARVHLQPDQVKTVRFKILLSDLRYYDTNTNSWRDEPGEYRVAVGPNSRDLPLSTSVTLR